ncbi:hypothetical protein HPB52_000806 [Rhipicephalus sanguineus]|uniref:Uncharacterized protein n=1 Tax=Rhipicephalus sanguineus TaxID=34632 RepID=A0A9D4SX66_RHISA|nr:hypothetical protein HPB52_000806 [Rhipicephalus sanguineus]
MVKHRPHHRGVHWQSGSGSGPWYGGEQPLTGQSGSPPRRLSDWQEGRCFQEPGGGKGGGPLVVAEPVGFVRSFLEVSEETAARYEAGTVLVLRRFLFLFLFFRGFPVVGARGASLMKAAAGLGGVVPLSDASSVSTTAVSLGSSAADMPGGLVETVVGFTWLTEPALVVVVVVVVELSDVADESWVEWDSDKSRESELSLLVSLSEEGTAGSSL